MGINGRLLFIAFLIIAVGAGVVWISDRISVEIGMAFGIASFIVLIMFGQQFLSANIMNNILTSLVKYDAAQADVEKERMKIQVEQVKAMKEVLKVEANISGEQYKQLQVAAQKMAGMLSEAEIQKVRQEMMGYGVHQLTDSTLNLDD